jgi:hypothetical protein
MELNPKKGIGIAKKVGFAFGYLLFNTIAFFALRLTNKIPQDYTWWHIVPFTLFILLLGIFIKQTGK